MIEKLDILKNVANCVNKDGLTRVVSGPDCICKINEIIDELNHILEERESGIKVYEEVMPNMKPADPFAEQRKWIGKLCRFWQHDIENAVYDILEEINENKEEPFCPRDWHSFRYCEPVKPDDDIIYKGE